MHPCSFRFAKLMVVVCAGSWLAVSRVPAVGSTQDDGGGAEFIRTHPGLRCYVTPRPPYPLVSRAKHQQGIVVVKITFAKEGQVSAVELVKSSGYQELDGNVVNYIKARWRSTFGQQKITTQKLEYHLTNR